MDSAFTVVVCTRGRPQHVRRTLDRLHAERDRSSHFTIVVVDQSRHEDPDLRDRELHGALELVHDDGRGVSRARNIGLRRVKTPWVVYIDDDCLVEPGWARELAAAFDRHPEAAFVSPSVNGRPDPACDGLAVTSFPVERETVRRRAWPFAIGFGVCMAARTEWVERIGGWDERLGPGVPGFPAAEDMDFNYRLLRAGGVAVAVPQPRALHEQWRRCDDLPALFAGYATGWAGFACKCAATGDRMGALRLWTWGLYGALKMVASAGRRRSRLRLRVGLALLRGHVAGTARGLRRAW